jgi:uroporphyrinogen-III synthase
LGASAQEALTRLEDRPSRTLIITRVAKPGDALHRLAEGAGDNLIEWPAAVPTPFPNATPPSADFQWVWLGSPGAVRMASKWLSDHPGIRIATSGSGTADALTQELMERLEFCGNGHPRASLATFLQRRQEGETVAIPHGDQSLRRWEDIDTHAQLHPWIAYTMEPSGATPPEADVVCFTSPSNVQHWLGPQPRSSVALGTTTSEALTQRGWTHKVAEHPDAFGVWEAMQKV